MSRLLLALIFAFMIPTWASVCEDEIKSVTAIVRILENSLRLRDLEPAQVEEALLKGELQNPFADTERTPENLFFRNSFEKHRRRVKPEQVEPLRAQVRLVLKRRQGQVQQIESARERTKHVFFIKPEGDLPVIQAAAGVTQGVFESRPVLIGKFANVGEVSMHLLDPSHPDFEKRIVPVGNQTHDGLSMGDGFFFQANGRDYFVRRFNTSTYDLQDREEVLFPLTPSPARDAKRPNNLIYLPEFKKMISTWRSHHENNLEAEFSSWDLSGETPVREQPEEIVPATSTSLKVNIVDQRPIVGFVPSFNPRFRVEGITSSRIMMFYDYSEDPKLLARVVLQDQEKFYSHANPIAYLHRKRWFALAPIYDSRAAEYSLAQMDLIEEKVLRKVKLPDVDLKTVTELKSEIVDGQPTAIIRTEDGLALVRLSNRQVLWSSQNLRISSYALFQWQGTSYLLVATHDQHLQVRTASGDLMMSLKTKDIFIDDLFVYEQDGLPMALGLRGPGERPLTFSLLHTEEK